jgi:ATP-dependent helicase/nuclease subunit B
MASDNGTRRTLNQMTDFVTVIPSRENSIGYVAQTLMREHRSSLPDLSHIVILLPGYPAAGRLRLELLRIAEEQNISALLLPRIQTLKDFLDHLIPAADQVIPEEQRLLLLVDALHQHRHLYGASNPWLLAADLLKLFDELTLYRINLPQTAPEFAELLARCYRVTADHPSLLKEAHIVHTLWQAWHQQLQAEGWTDESSYYLRQLGQSLQRLPSHTHYYVAGCSRLIPAEMEWLCKLAEQRSLRVLVNGDIDDSGLLPRTGFLFRAAEGPFSGFLQAVFGTADMPLLQRARIFGAVNQSSPASERIRMQAADSFEHEIQLVALEVRRAVQRGENHIGVITEDRKLARRLRAYLERIGIELNDAVGWALSTTRAVALLENWLQCIENDFPHHAFLDLLKSAAPEDDEYLRLIYRFETDIVLHENIGSGITRYRKALQYRARRLPWWNTGVQQQLSELLDRYERAAAALHKLMRKQAPADALARELLLSLQSLQLHRLLAADEAGRQVLALLERMQRGALAVGARIDWLDFRVWLGYALETHYFSPPTTNPRVQLLNLQQSALQSFDTLIIAAADENHIPGPAGTLPFFNDAVRSALKLPDWEQRLHERQHLFRCLLENNPRIFVSWQQTANGEPLALSPWLEIINHFHENAYGKGLLAAPAKQAIQADIYADTANSSLPSVPARPRPAVAASAVPADITVSSHQRLLDCPYRFYVYDILQLKAADEIRQALQKSDYGERVHACLHAFHCGLEGLPGPFRQPITPENREQAIAMLQQIALAVFTADIEDSFLHRGWLQRWLTHIPDYIDWQIKHNVEWTVENAEQQYQIALDANLTLRGRIDRIERHGREIALIDYKTGGTPTLEEVLSGEDVQLPSYSLLREDVARVQYLGLDRKKIEDRTAVAGEELQELRQQVRTRLLETMTRIRAGEPLPALGQPPVCNYCDASGLCRRKIWQNQQQEQPE